MVRFTAGGNFDEFGQIKINLVVKGPKWLWVFVFRATELSIEYEIVVQGLIQYLDIIYCLNCNRGLSIEYVTVVHGLAQFIIIFEFLHICFEDLNVVSAGSNLQESRLVFRLSKCGSARRGLKQVREGCPGF